jgi:hypothetical protein
MHYRITSKAGADFGVWAGETRAAALLSMLRDGGGSALDVGLRADDPERLSFHNEEAAERLGGVEDWHIEEVSTEDAAFLAACEDHDTLYRCVSDRYDPDGSEPWTFREFVEMCECTWGDGPDVHLVGDEWHDEHGMVLVTWEVK